LCNTKPRSGETGQHPNVERAEVIKNLINIRIDNNNAEDDALIEDFYDRDAVFDNIEEVFDYDPPGGNNINNASTVYNPPAAETTIFIHQQSSASINNSDLQASVTRMLQPSQVPQLITTRKI
jgi:hypothetical protein